MEEFYSRKITVSMQSEEWEFMPKDAARWLEDRIDEILDKAATEIACLRSDPAYQVEVKA